MNAEEKDDDSRDSDCFIVGEIKPVKRPLVQKTLIIKSNSDGLIWKRNKSNKKKDKVRRASTDLDNIRSKKKHATLKVGGSVSSNSSQKKQTTLKVCGSVSSNSSKKMFSSSVSGGNIKSTIAPLSGHKDVYCESVTKNNSSLFSSQSGETSGIGSPSQTTDVSEKQSSINTNKIQLSPDTPKKRKMFKISEGTPKLESPPKDVIEPLIKILDSIEEGTNPGIRKDSHTGISSDISSNYKFRENSKLSSFLVKEMIKEEKNKHFSLFSERERDILDKFLSLKESACELFVRMLSRKKSWHRACNIIYKDISDNLENEFEELHRENYIDVNIEDEDLKVQMDLLKKPEVGNLFKAFNLSSKFMDSSKKEDLIHSLIQECQRQKSALDMFRGGQSTTRLDKLKSEVEKCLGSCFRLNNKTFLVFYKVLLLASFPHYYDEESQRFRNELQIRSQVFKNQIKFPPYELSSPVTVFDSPDAFDEYRKAVLLEDACNVSIDNKDFEKFVCVYLEAKGEFEKLLKNDKYTQHCLKLKPFLRKFSAGALYARILGKYCTTFKRKVDNSEVRNTAELLLNQSLYLTRKKGEWYEVLSQTFKNEKETNAAAEVLIRGLRDPGLSKVQKLTLQLKGQLILKAKTNAISDSSLRDMLNELCMSSVSDPTSVEIKGTALQDNESGFKCVYVEQSDGGKTYGTVEKRAISYYKSNGFTRGYHTEGVIVQSLYFLLFFDIIYGLSPEGVFLSPYQEAPLDFNSSLFYENRKEEIDILLADMSGWDDEELEAKIKYSYSRNNGTMCLIKWSAELTEELFCEVAKCITVPILVLIFQRLVKNFRQVRAGFPDLTLWNPETRKCKFVEVKSPTDRLSPGQRVWLDFLKNIGLECEVCNVKNVSGKSWG